MFLSVLGPCHCQAGFCEIFIIVIACEIPAALTDEEMPVFDQRSLTVGIVADGFAVAVNKGKIYAAGKPDAFTWRTFASVDQVWSPVIFLRIRKLPAIAFGYDAMRRQRHQVYAIGIIGGKPAILYAGQKDDHRHGQKHEHGSFQFT